MSCPCQPHLNPRPLLLSARRRGEGEKRALSFGLLGGRRWHRGGGCGAREVVAPAAVGTPWARDVARGRGVDIVREGQAPPAAAPSGGDALADQVRALVTAMLGSGGGELTAPTTSARHPVKLARRCHSRRPLPPRS